MRRRTVLATIPPLLAGCGGRSAEPEETPTDSSTVSPTDTKAPTDVPTETPTEPPPPWAEFDLLELERPTLRESEVRARLDDRYCAELQAGAVCSGVEARVSVMRSQSVASLPAAELEVTIRNDADETFEWNHYDWEFLTVAGGSWRWLAPMGTPQPLTPIDPGRTHTYTVRINEEPFEDLRLGAESYDIRFDGLGPGIYGLVNDSGYFGDPAEDPVPVGATFGLAGQAPPLRPTDDVGRVERDGSELVVETETDDETWELLVTFVDDGDADLLAEHVRMVEALRNTVSFAPNEGIDAVRYVGDPRSINTAHYYLPSWTPDDASSYNIGDHAFEIERIQG